MVEDEPALLTVTTRLLEGLGYSVVGASGPADAIRLAKECADRVQLLLTDVVMPEMNGRALSDHLLKLHPHLKLLFMSGYTGDIIANHGVLAAEGRFIQKPFSTAELAVMVRKALDS